MWRYLLLKGYALVVGVGLLVVSLISLLPSPPSPLRLELPENLMHIGTGFLFIGGSLLFHGANHLRGFLVGMGLLLVVGKALLIAMNWSDADYHRTVIAVICLVAGLGSVIVAALAGNVASPSRED